MRGGRPGSLADAVGTWSDLMIGGQLALRHRLPEVMDEPGIDPADHRAALEGLKRINALSRCVPSLYGPIRDLARRHPDQPLRVLDVACGGGDTVIGLHRLARRDGCRLIVHGCDISPRAVEMARTRSCRPGEEVAFFEADALGGPLPEGYDVILCSLFLHHLDEEDAVRLLGGMARAARRGVLVNDLIRSRLGYGLAWAGTRLLSRSWIVHYDGPVSVVGAFRPEEALALAERAGLSGVRVKRCWPERYLLSWWKGLEMEEHA